VAVSHRHPLPEGEGRASTGPSPSGVEGKARQISTIARRTSARTDSLAGSDSTRSMRPAPRPSPVPSSPGGEAGVPSRMPLVTKGLWVSNGMLFLFT